MKIIGWISFLGGLGWGLFALQMILFDKVYESELVIILGVLLSAISSVVYAIRTRFGENISELDKINYENRLLKLKIEQKELKRKLEG